MSRKRAREPAPLPYDGNPRTVDDLLDRLEVIREEEAAILDELRRLRNRADDALRKGST